jgi:thermitase
VNVLSTLPGDRYGYYSGTSMATPHVAGVATLLESRQPALDDAQLKAEILDSVDTVSGLQGDVLTGGRLNAASAVPSSTTADRVTDTTEPTVTQVSPTRTRDRTPRIAATVRDDRAELAQGDMTFALDGQPRGAFAYDASTDRLTFDSGKLSLGRHTARITATDAAGNTTTETKTFKVIRR